ncbi:MAG: acyl-CoA dehydrogenase [Frankiales bacterium]|nr:acyl-CoA dehydrogenase [Frankiales bacterium]
MSGDFLAGVHAAAAVAAEHVDDVDREARFPQEGIDALKDSSALSALADGVPFAEVAEACHVLGRACSATGMVFAMHQIEVACLLSTDDWPWAKGYLADLTREQRLIGSVTSEIGTGGDMGRSISAVEPQPDGSCTLIKQAPTVSYGEYADDFLTTARRAPEAEGGDQVAVMHLRDQTTMEKKGTWDPLGMRGTCSPGFVVSATFAPEQVHPTPYVTLGAETMVPVSHLLWSHLWVGIAVEAFERAKKSVKAAGTQGSSVKAQRLSELHGQLSGTRAQLAEALGRWQREYAEPGRPALQTMSATLRHNVLKTSVSRSVAGICQGALEITGIAGFRNDSPLAIGRLLRDSLSASLMVSNDRLHETNSALLMVVKEG